MDESWEFDLMCAKTCRASSLKFSLCEIFWEAPHGLCYVPCHHLKLLGVVKGAPQTTTDELLLLPKALLSANSAGKLFRQPLTCAQQLDMMAGGTAQTDPVLPVVSKWASQPNMPVTLGAKSTVP